MSCPALIESGRRRGERCGKPIRGFVAPGEGRCSRHSVSARQRIIALAVRNAVDDVRALRGLPREREHQEEPQRDEQPNGSAGFEWPGDGWTDVTDEDVPS